MGSGLAIAGIIIGVVLILVITAVIIFICNPSLLKKKDTKDDHSTVITKADAQVEGQVSKQANELETGQSTANVAAANIVAVDENGQVEKSSNARGSAGFLGYAFIFQFES